MKQIITIDRSYIQQLPNINWEKSKINHVFQYCSGKTNSLFANIPQPLYGYQNTCSKGTKATREQLERPLLPTKNKHQILFNEIIINDAGNLIPSWYNSAKLKQYVEKYRHINPETTLWISNHKLLNPAYDVDGKRSLLINIAKEFGIDGIGIQVWWNWRYDVVSTWAIDYIKKYADIVRKNSLLFTISEWAVFYVNQPQKQIDKAGKLLELFAELQPVWNCYWYFTDAEFKIKKQPGQDSASHPGLFDENMQRKPIAGLFGL